MKTQTPQETGRIRAVSRRLLDGLDPRATRSWTPPDVSQPRYPHASRFVLLGTIRERPWYTVQGEKDLGELEQLPGYVPEDSDLLEGILVSEYVDGERVYRRFQSHQPGTFLNRTTVVGPPVKVEKAKRPLDALALVALLTKSTGYNPGNRTRGAAAILDKLRRHGVELVLAPDGSSLVVIATGGDTIYRDAVQAAAALLVPYLRDGVAPPCAVSHHREPVEATTVAVAFPIGLPWCGSCGRTAA